MKTTEPVCCPEFEVQKLDNKTLTWEEKPFIMETIPTCFHIPFPPSIGKKIVKMMDLAGKSDACTTDLAEALILFRDPSAFRSEIYLSVTKKVEGANNTSISGTFQARVFDGKYNSIPQFIKEMDLSLKEKGLKAKDYCVHYAYCPKYAKKFGHNYLILFAQV